MSGACIRDVVVTVVAVPYRPGVGAIVTAGLVLTEARHVLVEVRTDDGVVGLGEAVPRPSIYGETVESIVVALQQLLVPPLLGMSPLDVERIWQRWERVVGNTTAKAALDMACHDIQGKLAGLPLHRMLGGWAGGRIPLTMPVAIADDMVEQAKTAVAGGYGAVKLKVGKDLRRDVATVEAVRSAIGPDPMLYADANQGYGTSDALEAARQFGSLGVDLLEEPVSAGNTAARVQLAREAHVPLLLDETLMTQSDLLREIQLGTPSAISVRSPRSGITGSRKVVALAEAAEVACLVGSHRELGVATIASAHLAAGFRAMRLPAELGVSTLLSHSLLTEPLRIDDGWLTLPDGPGLGIELDRAAVSRHRVGDAIAIAEAVR
ncbi:mandelate racemase/muconate lactonizing enzyme family protein [Conexibacter sp. CPCC 206217]|uniref:mandelate racemase/muconate lactonizing enzyme family protein n=1 Tax=Conexibacter sp. CPCC 206217 TaxID=3064574 RepID=UPI002720A595|nr:enolase C-terminal domain-like protein [Conexibacter sp. CPCC 206217]MDO8211717.1 enolase C-terminal domain-like protein [Conexibacter sp. CPCC 206217]